MIRTFADSSLLIALWRGNEALAAAAEREVFESGRSFVYSDFVVLETLPKAEHFRNHDEARTYRALFERWERARVSLQRIYMQARLVATRDGLGAMDSLHVAAATLTGCTELLTTEKRARSIHRATDLKVVALHE